jgi:hypothetical protein
MNLRGLLAGSMTDPPALLRVLDGIFCETLHSVEISITKRYFTSLFSMRV